MKKPLSGRRTILLTAAWGAALFGVLQLYRLPDTTGHSVCGPWGCGPPVQALIACHGFWLVLFSLPIGLLCHRLDTPVLRKAGMILLTCGILGLAGIAIWEGTHWWPRAGEFHRRYIVQRYLFAVVTLVDVPVVEIGIAGLTCFGVARLRKRREVRSFNALEQSLPAHQPTTIVEPIRPSSQSKASRHGSAC